MRADYDTGFGSPKLDEPTTGLPAEARRANHGLARRSSTSDPRACPPKLDERRRARLGGVSVFTRLWNGLTGRQVHASGSPSGSPARQGAQRSGAERRRHTRVRVLSALDGYEVELDTKVSIEEISVGGFSAESPLVFAVGSAQTFLFSTGAGIETMVQCVCRHVKLMDGTGGVKCVAGFEFLPNQEDSLQVIVDLHQRLRQRQG
jgi:hypothetical protein